MNALFAMFVLAQAIGGSPPPGAPPAPPAVQSAPAPAPQAPAGAVVQRARPPGPR